MTDRAIAWLDRLIWALIYVGLFMVVFGIVLGPRYLVAGWSLGIVGAIATIAGFVLVWVRSRIPETGEGGAKSPPKQS